MNEVVWLQTAREWGNGRTIMGVAHAFEATLPGEPERAACGYTPHAATDLIPPWDYTPHCARCEKKLA